MAANRPQPRTVKKNRTHPAAPAAAPEPASPVQTQQDAVVASPAPEPVAAPATQPSAAESEKKWRNKLSVYQDRDLTDRLRGAIIYTIPQEGPRSVSDFVNALIVRELDRLEAQYNEGKPFPPVGPKGVPQGRPMGEG